MEEQYLDDFEGSKRVGAFIMNWVLLMTAPVWCPISFLHYVFSHQKSRRDLYTGKRLIIE